MTQLMKKINVLSPSFLIKLASVNMLIRKLRRSGMVNVISINYAEKTPVLTVQVEDSETIFNSGIERGILTQYKGWIIHEVVISSVKLCWIECPAWEVVIDKRVKQGHQS